MKFTELDLDPAILRALREMNYTDLTPIQEETFPHIMAGKDLLAKAETGSGKTSACAIPVAARTRSGLNAVQTLIVVPTRELAQQYVAEISAVCKYNGAVAFAVFGGMPMDVQRAKLDHGVHILVATPGRLIDFLYNTPLSLSHVTTFVLDEADEMMKMGFIDDVHFLMSCMVHEHQTLFFSATMPRDVDKLAHECLRDPVRIDLNANQVAPQSLVHHFRQVSQGDRYDALRDFLHEEDIRQAILFCNTRAGADKLYSHLRRDFDSAEIIHGGFEQGKRISIFNRFKEGKVRYMVATDVAGRGLDFSHVTHVINYEFPRNPEMYTHRTGRTGRMGRKGDALSLVTRSDLGLVKQIVERHHIEPRWHGEEPDLKHTPRHHAGGRGPGGPRKGGRRPSRGPRKGGA